MSKVKSEPEEQQNPELEKVLGEQNPELAKALEGQQNPEITKVKPRAAAKHRVFKMPDGTLIPTAQFKSLSNFDRDVIIHCNGEEKVIIAATGKKKERVEWHTPYNPDEPRPTEVIKPGLQSPVCKNCGLYDHNCRHPFMDYAGSTHPLITIIFDGVTRAEDIEGVLGSDGSPGRIARIIEESSEETGVSLNDVRWVPMTRCSNWLKKQVNLKPRGNWCRYHVVDDLMRHPPALVMPVGTTALGLLSHKSNAQEWGGRLLTYRGWPDDWLTEQKYALPRLDPRAQGKTLTGHPLFGPLPDMRIPMVPIQAPRLIDATRNQLVRDRWTRSIVRALRMAKEGVKALDYTRSWYHFTDDVASIERSLTNLLNFPGIHLCYDTETTGLRQWADNAAIVAMMFRWVDPVSHEPRSLGFPWDYQGSEVQSSIKHLKHLVWKVLTQSTLIGHNLTFDMLYTYATFWRTNLAKWDETALNLKRDKVMRTLANASKYDTWHMAFALQQRRGSLGLEVLAYDWVPELAGYEEDMSLLIDLHYDTMHPGAGKGGHYLNCSKDKWDSHLIPYVMGDVEVCHEAHGKILKKLQNSPVYEFPLADPQATGRFRLFTPPSRDWVYREIVSPAARVLMKMMARGLYIDTRALAEMERVMPTRILDLREKLKEVDPRITDWCAEQKATVKAEGKATEAWELDLENKKQLKDLLFDCLDLPVLRFTKGGRKLLGDDVPKAKEAMSKAMLAERPELEGHPERLDQAVEEQLREVAAVDKFTLNKIIAENKHLAPLQDYRKLYKLYTTYVRPMCNTFNDKLDKKQRTRDRHLCFDQCIHASFLLTGTRAGRLSCRDPNLQQLPRDGEVKQMFVSRFGPRGCMYQGDLSQIELRLMAAACGDPTMVKAYFEGTDLHSLTASRIYDIPYDHFTKEYMKELQERGYSEEAKELELKRVTAKTTNFLTGYGGGAFGLQNVLAMNRISKKIEECQEIIELFFSSYPSLKRFLMKYKRFITDSRVAVSIFGRIRVFEEVLGEDEEAKAKALRAGCNHIIQATASDMMLTALVVIESLMRDEGLESMLVSTVHDSLVIDCVRTELPIVHKIVMDVVNNFPSVFKALFGEDYDTSWMIVPFTGDCEVGTDYLTTRKIPARNIDWDKLLAE